MLSKSDLENLTRSDLETLARLGYDRPTLLKLVAFDIEKKGKYLLNLIQPGSATVPVPPKTYGMGPAERPPAKKNPPNPRRPKPPAKNLPAKPPAEKRALSPEARANIIAAQKKRWAAYHEEKGSAA